MRFLVRPVLPAPERPREAGERGGQEGERLVRVACSGCRVHISGDPNDPVVSHGACSRECFEFFGALKEWKAELLEVDPLVAAFAVRFSSETRPKSGLTHDVSLLVDYRETTDSYGDPIDAPSGRLSWECFCEAMTLSEIPEDENGKPLPIPPCKHINRAVQLRALHSRMTAYAKARRAAS